MGPIERAQRVGGGEAFQCGTAETTAPRQILGVPIAVAARFDEALGVGFGEALDLAQPQAQRTVAEQCIRAAVCPIVVIPVPHPAKAPAATAAAPISTATY